MKSVSCLLCVACLLAHSREPAEAGVRGGNENPSRYNVVWDSPGKNHQGSMPLGNGDIGLNAWAEESGDLLFYIGKTDSWDENGRLLKVGKVRVTLEPPPPVPLSGFSQTLDLHSATLRVRYGAGGSAVTMRLWVDAHHPVIRLEINCETPVKAVASIELWRTHREVLPSVEVSDVLKGRLGADSAQVPITVEPDSLLPLRAGRIGWFHHNARSTGPALTAAIQGLEGFSRIDPLLHRTVGAIVTAERSETLDGRRLASPRSKRHLFNTFVLTQHPSSPKDWLAAIEELIRRTGANSPAATRARHESWWRSFWARSWIHATSKGTPGEENDGFVVSRAYALQRFINACAGRGAFPIKFNGSIFTVPYPGRPGDADYRQWGPGYWWQNTRLPYISMPASGDFDLMEPLFRMYGKDLVPLFKYRTRHALGHDGIFIPECIYFWGDVFSETYGWTPFESRQDKLQESRWHKWEWVSGPELVWMMLDAYDHTLDGKFLQEMVIPTAREILTFFDQHYPAGSGGRMVMNPAQACETWWECTDPMPEVAGLHAVTRRLLSLPEEQTTAGQREFWKKLQAKLPDLPVQTVEKKTMLAPAAKFAMKMNIENPELYAVFPFRLVTFATADAGLALEAFRHRPDRGNFGWRQDDVFAAYLGLADTARAYLAGRARMTNPESRFPGFWGPNYDWIPDQDHGGILLKTLQAMVLQTDGKEIHLLPAWPAEWDVEFKLHAPHRTTIEGRLVSGRLEDIAVTPRERTSDLKIHRVNPHK